MEERRSIEDPKAEPRDMCEDAKQSTDSMAEEPGSANDSQANSFDMCEDAKWTDDKIEGEPRSIEDPQAQLWDMCEDAKQFESPTVKFFCKVPEGFQAHNPDFPSYLKKYHFTEVSSPELCDIILNFCPADSEVGPFIEEIPACKPAILALMHQTMDPAHVVPDSRCNETDLCKKNIHIVHFLYQKDEGLLECENNDRSIKEILESLEWDMCPDAKEAECPSVRVHKIVPRSVKNHISPFKTCLEDSPNMTEVNTTEWSDVTLAFCPIVSRVGTDIEAAFRDIEDSKPAILVAMHHTYDKEYVIPDTSRFGRNKNVLIVDCLFHEDLGLLPCKANQEAVDKFKMRLYEEHKKKNSQTMDSSSLSQKSALDIISYVYNLTGYPLAKFEHLFSLLSGTQGDSLIQPPSEK